MGPTMACKTQHTQHSWVIIKSCSTSNFNFLVLTHQRLLPITLPSFSPFLHSLHTLFLLKHSHTQTMAKPSEDSQLRFPDKDNKKNGVTTEFDAEFGFPSEFPYEFDSFGMEPLNSPPVESVAGSTETESSDEEDFFAGLTRRLSQATIHETRNQQLSVPINDSEKAEIEKKTRVLAGSPQSILSGIGSWSCKSGGSGEGSPDGGCSRVPSPFSADNDAWDVIYAAAGQVARLKMNNDADFQNRGFLCGLPYATASFQNPNPPHLFNNASQSRIQFQLPEQVLKQQLCGSVWGRQIQAQNRGYDNGLKCSRSLAQPAWPHLHPKHQNQNLNRVGSGYRPGLHTGSGGVKRGCAGTGVFLPRQYGAPPPQPEPRKKTICAPVVVPAKVFHALNLNVDELNNTTQPRFSSGLGADYDALLARRNAIMMQQQRLALLRREEAASYEVRLPQEWTY